MRRLLGLLMLVGMVTMATSCALPDTTQRITFASNYSGFILPGKSDLCIMDANGKNTRKLPVISTEKTGIVSFPTWNPDGTKLAFVGTECVGSAFTPRVYIMDIDGKNTVEIGIGDDAVWSPDGTKIAYRKFMRHVTEIKRFDGKDWKKYMEIEGSALVWNPDNTRVAFVAKRDTDRSAEVYVMNLSTGATNRLTENELSDLYPVWSPNGTKIAFVRSKEYGREANVWLMDADGKNQTKLTENVKTGWWGMSPAWNPSGTSIMFMREIEAKKEKRDPRMRDDETEIWVMDTDGKNQKELAQGSAPVWSPDGTKITFVSERDGNKEIYTMDTEGKNQKRLTDDHASDDCPTWYPLLDKTR